MSSIQPIRVGLCGEFQVGKSLLLNCLLEDNQAFVGDHFPTTPFPIAYRWGSRPCAELLRNNGTLARKFESSKHLVDYLRKAHASEAGKAKVRQFAEARVFLPNPKLRSVEVVDTPGFNAQEDDEKKADLALRTLDFAVLVTRNDRQFSQLEKNLIQKIADTHLPFAIVMNCHDSAEWKPSHRQNLQIAKTNAAEMRDQDRHPIPIGSNQVITVNAVWHKVAREKGESSWSKKVIREFDGVIPAPDQLCQLSQVPLLHSFIFPEESQQVGTNAFCIGAINRIGRQLSDKIKVRLQRINNLLERTQ